MKPGAGQGSSLRVAPPVQKILRRTLSLSGAELSYTTEAASLRPLTWMPCNTSGSGWRGSGGFGLRAIPRGPAGVGAVAVAAPSQQGEGAPRRAGGEGGRWAHWGRRCGGGGVAAAVVAGRCWLRYAAYAEFFNGGEGFDVVKVV